MVIQNQMEKAQVVSLEEVKIGERKRSLRAVEGLADSIKRIGLLHPIVIDENNNLISGYHRLEAYKILGRKKIPVRIVSLEGLKVELAEIDENILTYPLTELEKALQYKRRKEIYEELYPETKKGGDRRSIKATESRIDKKESFTKSTAEKLDKSERTIQRLLEIGKKINPDVVSKLTGTSWENFNKDLHQLVQYNHEEQVKIVDDYNKNLIKSVPPQKATASSFKKIENEIEFFLQIETLTQDLMKITELCKEVLVYYQKDKDGILGQLRQLNDSFRKLKEQKKSLENNYKSLKEIISEEITKGENE